MGLENLGNSCFINATLQCLAALPELVHHSQQHQASPRCSDSAAGEWAGAFSELLSALQAAEPGSCLSPSRCASCHTYTASNGKARQSKARRKGTRQGGREEDKSQHDKALLNTQSCSAPCRLQSRAAASPPAGRSLTNHCTTVARQGRGRCSKPEPSQSCSAPCRLPLSQQVCCSSDTATAQYHGLVGYISMSSVEQESCKDVGSQSRQLQ